MDNPDRGKLATYYIVTQGLDPQIIHNFQARNMDAAKKHRDAISPKGKLAIVVEE
jgi:hypothetical protein